MATSSRLIQIKASGMMCSFCTMSVEKALARVPGVHSVQVNLVHGIILVDADRDRVTEQQVAQKVEDLGYTVLRPRRSRSPPTTRSSRPSGGAGAS